MVAEGRDLGELGWEDSIKQDSQDFEPIPEGDYNVTIEKYDRSRSKGEGKLPPCRMAVVYFTVHTQNRDVTIRENYILHKNLEWNIDIWNLRGKSVPMDKLAPKLIRRAAKKNYVAIIIDPIYKVITGDENSADQMANFCNQFDKVCTELGCAVIYCHHHSKGNQGGKKSMDRASGSGVFARDPDALLDLIELEPTEALMKQEENKAVCGTCKAYLDAHYKWQDDLSQDDLLSSTQMLGYCEAHLDKWQKIALDKQITAAKVAVQARTAWRIEGTLREFPKFEPVNMWFDYPVHRIDQVGSLKDLQLEDDKPAWQKKQKSPEERKKDKEDSLRLAFEANDMDGNGSVKISDLVTYMGVTLNTVKKYVDSSKEFKRENGMIFKVSKVSKNNE